MKTGFLGLAQIDLGAGLIAAPSIAFKDAPAITSHKDSREISPLFASAMERTIALGAA
jgi:hypothetical protein